MTKKLKAREFTQKEKEIEHIVRQVLKRDGKDKRELMKLIEGMDKIQFA